MRRIRIFRPRSARRATRPADRLAPVDPLPGQKAADSADPMSPPAADDLDLRSPSGRPLPY